MWRWMRNRRSQAHLLTLPFTGHVSIDNLLNLSESQFPNSESDDNIILQPVRESYVLFLDIISLLAPWEYLKCRF